MVDKEKQIKIKVGKSYSGDALLEALGGDINDRLHACGNEQIIVVAEDEGNDNYQVVAVLATVKDAEELADEIATCIGDTFIDWHLLSPQEQWERIILRLREHGYLVRKEVA
jgi:hypothetical protein